jgi:hypothetical protein
VEYIEEGHDERGCFAEKIQDSSCPDLNMPEQYLPTKEVMAMSYRQMWSTRSLKKDMFRITMRSIHK